MSTARRLDTWLEENAWASALILIGLFLAAMIVLSIRSKFWIDEIFTYYIVRQPGASEVIKAIQEGCDNQPPLYALIVRALSPVFGNGPLGLRLPSTIGVCIMSLSVFAFTLRRFPALYAVVAMLFALNSMRYFAIQARSYGLVLGCAGIALLCWQRAAEPRHRLAALIGLALSLSLGIALHYYMVFLLLPLAAGELARWSASGKFDLPVWSAVAISPLVLVPHLPLLAAARPFIRYFWAKDPLLSLSEVYSVYFVRYSLGLLLPAIIFFIWRYPRVPSVAGRRVRPGMPFDEWVVTGSLVFAPVLTAMICRLTTGIFVERYVTWSILGFSILSTAILFRAVRGDAIAAAIAVIIFLTTLAGRSALNLAHADRLIQGGEANAALQHLPASSLPIVLADIHAFMELSLYAEPGLRARLVYPVKLELHQFYTNIDTNARLLSAVRHRAPLRVPDYDDFIASNPHFLLVAESGDWLIWHLTQSGFQVSPLQKQWPPKTFEVTSPAAVRDRNPQP